MKEYDSSLLAESHPVSSHEVERASPTPTLSQQQNFQAPTSEIPIYDSAISSSVAQKTWWVSRHVSHWVILLFIGYFSRITKKRSNISLLNLLLIPIILATPFIFHVFDRHYNGIIMNLLMLLFPIGALCVGLVAGALVSPIAIVFLPCLLLSFILVRLLQFIRHGEAYDNLVLLKFYIRTWIYYLYLYSIAPALAIFLAIAWYSRSLQSIFFHGLLLGYSDPTKRKVLGVWQRICFCISTMLMISTILLILAFSYIPRLQLDLLESGINIPEAVLEVADCLNVFIWMKILLKITAAPALKHHKILGLETWKWIQAFIFIVIIYNAITILTRVSVWSLQKYVSHDKPVTQKETATGRSSILHKIFRRRYLVYWGNGMKHSINFILSSSLFLFAWVLYFRSYLKTTPTARKVWEFGTWTYLSFLTCAILWLIKNCVVLSWEADSIYVRLESKILQGAKQLYFLGIMGRHDYDIFNLLYHDEMPKGQKKWGFIQTFSRLQHMFTFSFVINLSTQYHSKTDAVDEWENDKKLSQKKNNRAKDYLLMQGNQTPTIYGVQQAALYFFMAKSKLLEEKYTSVILKKLESYNQDDDDNSGIEQNLKRLIGEEHWEDFQHQLDEYVGSSESICFETKLTAWMEMAHNNCLFLANTLSSGKEVVDCLNNIISFVLIFASFIMWLLLTGLATTKVLVLISAPLLAGSFMFQNTCKILFEGIMFVYVVHPFNVGDLCIIDEKMMEVRTVGVWRTTFSKIGSQEEVIYSNSELATTSIVNHKTDFDWNESVEVDVGSLRNGKIKNLKEEIEKYLDGNKDKYTPGYNSVEVLTDGDILKLVVCFRHKVNLKNSNFFKCLKEKRKLRSEFVLEAEKLADRNQNRESIT
ncbi:hypothetical protein SOVF_173410 isoform A [Spinacia oleracea]|nr:hypothetical protein SOVF_173410 isoform A [Spinacia oleracea]